MLFCDSSFPLLSFCATLWQDLMGISDDSEDDDDDDDDDDESEDEKPAKVTLKLNLMVFVVWS